MGAILVVEDNQVNALILRAMLRRRGYDPVMARDGLAAIALAEEHRPRLILMDLQMPRLDGFAAAAEIRRRLDKKAPVIVAVTANVGPEVENACLAGGFADVLAKPIVFDALIAMVQRHLADTSRS